MCAVDFVVTPPRRVVGVHGEGRVREGGDVRGAGQVPRGDW